MPALLAWAQRDEYMLSFVRLAVLLCTHSTETNNIFSGKLVQYILVRYQLYIQPPPRTGYY